MIIANDATSSGRVFPMTAKRCCAAQTIALENRIPTLYLSTLRGVFCRCSEDVFRIPTILHGCSQQRGVLFRWECRRLRPLWDVRAGGAYLPVMTDTVLMTEGSGLFLAGPSLVQAAIGQKTDAEELGGAAMHAEISGTVDFREPTIISAWRDCVPCG